MSWNDFINSNAQAISNQASQTNYPSLSAYAQQSLHNHSIMTTAYTRADLERQIAAMQKQLQTVPLPGPTPEQLEKYPALMHAWEEFKLVAKITMGEKQ